MTNPNTSPSGLPPLQHQTLAVDDLHYIGRDGLPDWHHTRQRIRALNKLETPMTRMSYRFSEADTLRVDVHAGGRAGKDYQAAEGIRAIDIELDEPLEPGQETDLAYTTLFRYRKAPPTEFRRRVGAQPMEHLGMTVVFNALHLPAEVCQTEWQGHEPSSPIVTEESVTLTPHTAMPGLDMEAETVYSDIAGRTVGFRWQWPPQ